MRLAAVIRLFAAVALACGIAFSGRATVATETITFNGLWWASLSETEQGEVVEGILVGFNAGAAAGYLRARTLVALDQGENRAHFQALLDRNFRPRLTFGKTFGTYVHEISDFYANNPTLTNVTVDKFFDCFADQPMIPCAREAELLRKSLSNGG